MGALQPAVIAVECNRAARAEHDRYHRRAYADHQAVDDRLPDLAMLEELVVPDPDVGPSKVLPKRAPLKEFRTTTAIGR